MNNIMNDTQTNTERIVMRRVLRIRILRLIISTVVLALLTTIATLWGIGREVWAARIFENSPSNIENLPSFYLSAFLHTNIIVQGLSILTLVSLLFLAREVIRLAFNLLTPSRS